MKVLLVHNDYGKYSGEEAVVDKMAGIFSDLGYEVAQLRMSTADARESFTGKIRVFTSGLHSASGVRAMREALKREKPDVVNVHNVYPFISPAALRECKRAGVPVVMTVHNFRLICPTGLFMRNGAPCEVCLERGDEWTCVKYNCEKSLLKSVAYAARNAIARRKRHFTECVDRFACITDFQRRKLIEAGFPKERMTVIPNSMEISSPIQNSSDKPLNSKSSIPHPKFNYVAFCGRLSREKGIDLILEAARNLPKVTFKLAGAVGDPELVENLPKNVKVVGYLSGKDLEDFYRNALFMIMASRWYEGFPMAILEAAKYSKATIGPDHGGFTEIIGGSMDAEGVREEPIGLLFEPGNAEDLTKQIKYLWENHEEACRLGKKARERLETKYSTQVVGRQWQSLLNNLTE